MGNEEKKIQFTESRSLPTQFLCTFIHLFSTKEHEKKKRKAITFKKHEYKALIFTKHNKR
jgi:hypothetical protein